LLPPTGDERLKFKGYFTRVPSSPAIDPLTNGVRLLVVDARGVIRIDISIAGGAYDAETGAGWREMPASSSWQYRNAGRVVPRPGGIEKVKLRMLDKPPGTMRFDVKGKDGDYHIDPADLPLVATLVVDAPVARTGQCGEARFPGAWPDGPSCVSVQGGNTIDCG
jgi:hypothetical protein